MSTLTMSKLTMSKLLILLCLVAAQLSSSSSYKINIALQIEESKQNVFMAKMPLMTHSNSTHTNDSIEKLAGQTGNKLVKASAGPVTECERYNGDCSSADACSTICGNAGHDFYTFYPTLHLCCCDCSAICL
eukprot:GFUD01023338.1.p1 GENE.GFUD01023338.1~~GFUD01023338.1.p1  ORF type:complete len:132 (-),score=48.22 GFUD01023338.1:311-706(-)